MQQFDDLLHQHLLPQLYRHKALRLAYGEDAPEGYDLHQGVAWYNNQEMPIQLLGTYSTNDQSFCWAWASPNPMPAPLIQSSLQLKEWFSVNGMKHLVDAGGIPKVDPLRLCAVSAGILNESYVIEILRFTNTIHGCILVSHPEPLPRLTPHPLCRMMQYALQQHLHRHLEPTLSFLQQIGFEVIQNGRHWNANRDDGTITITLDEQDYVSQITPLTQDATGNLQ
ncbi:hypothetical protein HCH_03327 [Hahella chejuensis KCTC 2396]|uniref:Uncharacterized protein n=2 Tax=Hahella chejuensis TaxID=158327 RepID=Q2SGZ2_HAHCH|nr:hypothetical protein HCH_03327 [Hahella chejuensis KCTC 2396]